MIEFSSEQLRFPAVEGLTQHLAEAQPATTISKLFKFASLSRVNYY